jgi:uncharacterized protein YjbI with pentapeptide repeats
MWHEHLQIKGFRLDAAKQHIHGSQPGAVYFDDAEHRCYVKFPLVDHHDPKANALSARSEVLAAKLAQLAKTDLRIPDCRLLELADSDKGFVYGVVSGWLEGFDSSAPINSFSAQVRAQMFIMHAWLKNWDGVVRGNYGIVDEHGAAAIDFGGALNLRANPSPDEYITKSEYHGEIFSFTVTAIDTMQDEKRNPHGHQFVPGITNADFKAAAQYIVDIPDTEIIATVRQHGFGSEEEKQTLAITLIRRKYDIAHRFGVIPSQLTRYSLFPDIADFILLVYGYMNHPGDDSYLSLYKEYRCPVGQTPVRRIKHGIEHSARTAIYIDMLIELYRPYISETLLSELTPERIKMLKIAALCHDLGRTCDFGGDTAESETRNYEICRNLLEALRYNPDAAERFAAFILNKDQVEGLQLSAETSIEEFLRILLHDADVLDVLRSHNRRFDHGFLIFWRHIAHSNWTAHKDLFRLVEAVGNMLIKMGDLPQGLDYEVENPDRHERISVHLEPRFSLTQKEHYTNSLIPFGDIYDEFWRDRQFHLYLENSFISMPVFGKGDYPEYLPEGCRHLPQEPESETTSVQLHQPATQGPLPYAEVYTDDDLLKAGLQRHRTRKLVLAKGAPYPPHVLIGNGGFHPKGVLPDQTLRANALNVIDHRGKESAGSGVVSSTKNRTMAKHFAFYKSEEDTGYVYIFIAPPGAISDHPESREHNPFPDESEFSIAGGIDHTDIILWREVAICDNRKSTRFNGPLHINEKLFRKYASYIPDICSFLLEKYECLYIPHMRDKIHESRAILQIFLNCAVKAETIDETLMADFCDVMYYCSDSMLLDHLERMDDENKAILVQRSIILSAICHINNLLQAILAMPESDPVKEQVLVEAIYSENVVAVKIVSPQIDIGSISLDPQKISMEMAWQLMHISEALFISLLAKCEEDYRRRIVKFSIIKKECGLLSNFVHIDKNLIVQLYQEGWRNFAGLVLKNIDLSGLDLADVDLTGADLTGANLTGANLTGADLRSARLDRNTLIQLYDAGHRDFSGVTLEGVDIRGINLAGANFTGANLRGVCLDRDALIQLYKANVRNFSELDLRGINNFKPINLFDINATVVSLDRDALIQLYEANVRNFRNVKLEDVDLRGINLAGTDFTNANLIRVQVDINVLRQLFESGLENFSGVDLKGIWLETEIFIQLYAAGCKNFRSAILVDVDFMGINLDGVDLHGAHLDPEQLEQLYKAGHRDFRGIKLTHEPPKAINLGSFNGAIFDQNVLNKFYDADQMDSANQRDAHPEYLPNPSSGF